MTSPSRGLLDTVLDRRPLVTGGYSGARLERVRLAGGRELVVKHVDPAADWVSQATGDSGRMLGLWSSGVLARVPVMIEHAVVAVEHDSQAGWAVVMRDVSEALFADGHLLSRPESRRLLDATSALHTTFRSAEPVGGLTPLSALYRFLSPQVTERFAGEAEVPRHAGRGWRRFAELVPAEVAAAVSRVHDRPDQFAAQLSSHPSTLVHGDLKIANLGFLGERVVMLDWGSLTTWAPAAVDYAWYLGVNAASIDASHDELLEDVRAAAGAEHDEAALRLALLGALAQLGWIKALGAAEDADASVRRREQEGLTWWSARAREGAEIWKAG